MEKLRKLTITIILTMVLASCSGLSPLSLLSGKGTNVAANTQVGKENTQNVGVNNTFRPQARATGPVEKIDQSNNTGRVNTESVDTIIVNEIPTWMILAFGLLCGFLIPSPREIFRSLYHAVKQITGRK